MGSPSECPRVAQRVSAHGDCEEEHLSPAGGLAGQTPQLLSAWIHQHILPAANVCSPEAAASPWSTRGPAQPISRRRGSASSSLVWLKDAPLASLSLPWNCAAMQDPPCLKSPSFSLLHQDGPVGSFFRLLPLPPPYASQVFPPTNTYVLTPAVASASQRMWIHTGTTQGLKPWNLSRHFPFFPSLLFSFLQKEASSKGMTIQASNFRRPRKRTTPRTR